MTRNNLVLVLLGALALVACLVATAPAEAQGQDCGECQGWPTGGHYMYDNGSSASLDCGSEHSDPDQCHNQVKGNECGQHQACPLVAIPGLEDDLNVDGLLNLVNDGKLAMISKRVDRLPIYLKLNDERTALQVMGCDGKAVVAHIPLSEEVFRAIANSTN